MAYMSVHSAILVALICAIVAFLPSLLYPKDDGPFDFENIIVERSLPTSERWNIVITGANSGLGLGSVAHFARLPNCRIIMACRSLERCEEARESISSVHRSTYIVCLKLDLGSRESTAAFVHDLLTLLSDGNEAPKVHILMNNAGILNPFSDLVYMEGAELHVRVNHLGHFHLTHLLWKYLEAGRARIVFVSSALALLPTDAAAEWYDNHNGKNLWNSWYWWRSIYLPLCYSRSKRANLMMAAELHHRYNDTIVSLASHPGYSRTNLITSGFALAPSFVRTTLHSNPIGSMSASEGAWTQVRAALDRNIASGTYIGPKYVSAGNAVPVGSFVEKSWHHFPFSRKESVRLFEESMEYFGIKEFGLE